MAEVIEKMLIMGLKNIENRGSMGRSRAEYT